MSQTSTRNSNKPLTLSPKICTIDNMENNNDSNMVQCGMCQDSKPLSSMAYGLVWGDKVCEPCASTLTDYKNDK